MHGCTLSGRMYVLFLSLHTLCIFVMYCFLLQSLDSAIASHEPTVVSLNQAAQKLMASNTADNTAEIEQDIAALNDKSVCV